MKPVAFKKLCCESVSAAVAAMLISSATAEAQDSASGASTRRVRVAPAPEYRAEGFKEKLLGTGWRDLWVTPTDAPVFEMDRFAGGLKFLERGGGMQTLSLHFVEKTGWREYQFRSVNKYPLIQAMPPAVRNTPAGDILQDQVSHLLPGAPLLLPPLLEAIGALHVKPGLYVMHDDPKLGIYRDTFATMLGTVELNPQEGPNDQPGFAGSKKIQSTGKFLETLQESRSHRFDEKELFAVRLVDFLVNDTDRGPDNMRFARFGDKGDYRWRPLPRDRDRAFTDAGGWLVKYVMRPVYPKLVAFTPEYDLEGLTFTGHEIDRRLMQRLTKRDAEEVASRVQRAITDDVIERVIAQLPSQWRARTTAPARLRSVLRARRDNIPGMADEFYAWLATEVDMHGTDEDELAEIERHPDGRVTLTISGPGDASGVEPYAHRTFYPEETNEIRVYLHGGKDRAVVKGTSNDAIIVRVIGGGGDDVLEDQTSGSGVRFYDEKGDNRFATARSTKVSTKEWTPPKEGAGVGFDSPWRPDYGGKTGFGPTLGFAYGGGLVVGAGPRYKTNGFRRLPHRVEASANAMIGLGNGRPGVNMKVDYRAENSPVAIVLNARATRFEAFSFRGFGNETPELSDERARVNQNLVAIEPLYVYQVGWRSREGVGDAIMLKESKSSALLPMYGKLSIGPVAYWTDALPPSSSPYAAEAAKGRDVEGRVGARLLLDIDQTASAAVPDRGWRLQSELAGYPAVWDVNDSFGTAAVSGAAYVPLPGEGTHFAVRAGGAVASDRTPVLHSPAIGGRQTLRGYSWRRYTGERTAFGSAELRVPTGSVPLFIRWTMGVFGLADVGRVWVSGDSPGGWRTGYGGGMWLSTLGQTFSVSYARGEKSGFYVQKGMSF